MDIILLIIGIIWFFASNSRIQKLVRELDILKKRVVTLENAQLQYKDREPSMRAAYVVTPEIAEKPHAPEYFTAPRVELELPGEREDFAAKSVAPEKQSVEFNLGAKLPVWIGAVCLICAGFF